MSIENLPLRIDIGCGGKKREGFIGVDQYPMPGVDHICRVGVEPLPFGDATVDEAHCSHFYEHLTAIQRMQFMNELFRVMKPKATCAVIVPHWASGRAYGDLTHQWPPVSEFHFYYLLRSWREENAPHTDKRWNPEGFDCDFDATWGYGLHPLLMTRNSEFQQHALTFYREAAQDIHATLTKR